MTVHDLWQHLADPGSWRCWDEPVTALPDDPAYRADIERARRRTGLDESVVTGEARVAGRRVALVGCEFGFLAGSIGVDAGERLTLAVERATREGLPLLASPASGGTRMQEGTTAFVQMVKVTAAVTAHKTAGLPYLVYLRHPTTGGVLASWGSLGHVTAAEPGALIGFLGPRVHQALYDEEFPSGVQTAENLLAHGLLDAVLPARLLSTAARRALTVLCGEDTAVNAESSTMTSASCHALTTGAGTPSTAPPSTAPPPTTTSVMQPAVTRPAAAQTARAPQAPAPDVPLAGESIRRSRRPERPGVRALLRIAATDVTPLSGTGAGERDPGLLLALARVGGIPCVVLGHDRPEPGTEPSGAIPPALGPAGLREARRGMRIAAELGLPLLTVVDTAGAALSVDAEQGGLAAEIARCLADLVTLPAPTVCLMLGQGAGGGALALLPADRVLAARHAWLSPLPPEGASAILHRTTDRAFEVAARQGVRTADLLAHGIVDRVIDEGPGDGPGDAADDPVPFLRRLSQVLGAELAALRAVPPRERTAARAARHRHL